MAGVMKAAIIMHNVIVEERLNGYDSEMFKRSLDAEESGMIIDEFNEKQFT